MTPMSPMPSAISPEMLFGPPCEELPLSRSLFQYEKLDLLSKTDRRWMVEAWGEAPAHTTANERYRDVWDRYEDILIREDLARQ